MLASTVSMRLVMASPFAQNGWNTNVLVTASAIGRHLRA
jgi:hypothetical protein